MKGEGPNIALKAKIPHLEALFDRLATNLDVVLCLTLKWYHQFVDCKLASRDHSISDVLTDYSQQGVNLVVLGLSYFPLQTLWIDFEKVMNLFPSILGHHIF